MIGDGRVALARMLEALARRLGGPPSAGGARAPDRTPSTRVRPPGSPAGRPAPGRPRDEVVSARRLAAGDTDVAEWLDREARGVRSLTAAGVQLLDLSELRRRYADRWEHVCGAIRRVVEQTIDRSTEGGDLWIRGDGDTWMILYEGLRRPEAAERARAVAQEIARRLIGDGETGIPVTESALVRVHSLALELDDDPSGIRTLADLLASWQRALTAAREREQAAVRDLGQWCIATYQPVLNPRHARLERALAGQRVRMVGTTPAAIEDATGAVQAALDLEGLRVALQLLERSRGLIFVTLRYDTIAASSRRPSFAELCAAAPASARRRLVVEISDPPPAVPQSRIFAVLTPLYPRVLAIAVAVDPDEVAGNGEAALDRFVGQQHRLATLPAAAILADPERAGVIRRALARRRMHLAVLDVADPVAARRLARACRYLAGNGVAPAATAPIPVHPQRPPGAAGTRADPPTPADVRALDGPSAGWPSADPSATGAARARAARPIAAAPAARSRTA